MGSKPITQKAKCKYESKTPQMEVTVDAAGTQPASFPRMQPVTPAKQATEALVQGAYDSSQVTIPGIDMEEQKEKPQVGAYRRACGNKTDGSTGTDPQTGGTFKCAQAPAGQEPEEMETIITRGEDRTITIPGGTYEGKLEREVKGRVLSSPKTRKELRKLTQFLPKAGKDARKEFNLANEKQRAKLLQDAGLESDASRRDYVKAMKFKQQQKITKAKQNIFDTQAKGAERGKSAGQTVILGSETLPFAAQTRAQQIEQIKARSKNNNSFLPSTSTSSDFVPSSTEDLTRRFNFQTGKFAPRKKASSPIYKMGGYGSKAYKK